MANSRNNNQSTNNGHFGNRSKSLLIIDSIFLRKPFSNQTSLILLNGIISLGFNFINPTTTHNMVTRRKGNKVPSASSMQCRKLLIHSGCLGSEFLCRFY
ncbi:hypothetical protein CsSME_00001248 [Camellia sinensis var. sinensis]